MEPEKYRDTKVHKGFALSRAVVTPFLFTLVLLCAIALAGCASTGKGSAEFNKALRSWTRTAKLYDGIDLRLSITATYKNREFRQSYLDHYVDVYRLEEHAKEAMRSREFKDSERYNEFFLSVATPDKSINDLSSKKSVWRLYLEDGTGVKLSPVSITRVDTSSALTGARYPYLNTWSVGYIVRFPKYSVTGTKPVPNEKSRYLKLTIVGLLGNGRLVWKLDK